MNNLLTSISFSIHSNKGVFALLLGSGISKSAGIPTGWDIVLDLINKLAISNGGDCGNDPVEWFMKEYGEDPDYSNILGKLAKTSSERVNLLKKYFEPTEEEIEQKHKQPSVAHRAIARLIKKGYIKVVITTNFDRLLEKALIDEGVEPVVVSHVDDIEVALPLVHSDFTLVKVNGDYLDTRFLNTKAELDSYPEKMKKYLTSIINDFGIISCGWSGKWDIALVHAIRESENFRFYSYLTYMGNCENELHELAKRRKGATVKITGADNFFSEIEERVNALSDADNHPLSAAIAVSRLKRYVVSEEGKIQLHDLLKDESLNVYNKIQNIPNFNIVLNEPEFTNRIKLYESYLETLLPLIVNGVLWAKAYHYDMFIQVMKRISLPKDNNGGYSFTTSVHYYPALLCFYTIGVIAVKTNKYDLLKEVFNIELQESNHRYSDNMPLVVKLNSSRTINKDILNKVLSKTWHTPVSSFINGRLKPFVESIYLNEKEYNDCFDVFEYMVSLNYMFIGKHWGAPIGQYNWRKDLFQGKDFVIERLKSESEQKGSDWHPVKAGMFDGKYEQYVEVQKKLERFLEKCPMF